MVQDGQKFAANFTNWAQLCRQTCLILGERIIVNNNK